MEPSRLLQNQAIHESPTITRHGNIRRSGTLLKWRLLGETGCARNEILANQRVRGVLVGPCLAEHVYMEAVYTWPSLITERKLQSTAVEYSGVIHVGVDEDDIY